MPYMDIAIHCCSQHCKVEPIKLPPEECTEEFTFTVAVKAGKAHMFAAADEEDIQVWLKVLQVLIYNYNIT